MKNTKLPTILLIVSVILLFVNIAFTSANMNLGYWMRIISSVLVFAAMLAIIRERKKQQKKSQ